MILSKCYLVLTELSAGDLREWNILTVTGEPVPLIDEDGDEQEPFTPRSHADWVYVKSHGYDMEARRYAVLALGNLALSPEFHGELVTVASVEAIKSCMESDDGECVFNAAFAMNKITINEALLLSIGELGVIPVLVRALSLGDVDTIAQSVGALRHLAMCPENRIIMLDSGLLEPLALAAQGSDLETLRECAACMSFLTLTDALRMPVAGSSLLAPLMQLCAHKDVEIARFACGAVANMAESKRTHKTLAGPGQVGTPPDLARVKHN